MHTQRVLNTLTGRINEIRFAPCETTLLAPRDATCHAYTGDLDARVWYDARGAWVGLEFEGRDGSDITYRCTNCENKGT